MITDEIQELLDGGLGDERTAELLHTLSVSPEKRAAFRQHLNLRASMQADRLASAMTPGEDAALWGAIGAPTAVPVASAASRSWLARGAALLAAGTLGYLLGTTTIFSPVETAPGSTAAPASVAARSAAPATAPTTAPTTALTPTIEYRDRIVYRDRVEYRDRIVYRDRLVTLDAADVRDGRDGGVTLSPTTSDGRSTTDPSTLGGSISAASPDNASGSTPAVSSGSVSGGLDAAARGGAAPRASDSALDAASSTRTLPMLPPTPIDTVATRRSSNAIATTTSPYGGQVSAPQVQDSDDPWIAAAMDEGPSPMDQNGWEALYIERVGLLAPAPMKLESEDHGFSYRMLGMTYWFGGGRFGVGGRAGYGSFATVELSSREGSTGLGEEITGVVTSKNRIWMEGQMSWRAPLTRNLALTLEGNVGGSTHHTKLAVDAVGTFFVTDNIGLHAGVGLGRYWYSIAEERDRMLENTATGGVTSEVSSKYEGLMFEGRYGLFFRF